MGMRIGKVTQVYPNTGKVKVVYEDDSNASLKLSMLTMNQEYSLPNVGDRVLTMHMENGSSKGFVLGTYYGGGVQPKANAGYRKDFGSGVYVTCKSGRYQLSAGSIELSCGGATISFGRAKEESKLKADTLIIEAEDLILRCSYGEETVENILKRIERIEDQLGLTHNT